MHGLNWPAIRDKYLPLVDRVTDRAELGDLIAKMVSELSALHTFVRGGDAREAPDPIEPASLGAVVARDEAAGGYRIEHIYKSDPDLPDRLSPLARREVAAGEGDVIAAINGASALSVPDLGVLLRNQAGRQNLIHLKPRSGEARDVIVTPITPSKERDLRYDEWEYTRRQRVDQASAGKIGYVHLRAMGGRNVTEGAWLIEGHGVDPDIVVDNLPHATFDGDDAQLQAAVDHLMKRIRDEAIPVPPRPAYPDKSKRR